MTATQNATPRPAASCIVENIAEDTDDIASETDTRGTANQPSSSGSKPRKRTQSKPKKESTRGRNRSNLPQQYIAPSDTRFDDRFLLEVQYLYGLEPDPWGNLTVALVQRARDKVFTEFQDTLTTKSAVFRNVHQRPHPPNYISTDQGPQAKASLSSWRRALLKKAEKVIESYFTDEDRFPTATDIARQAQFLLGDGKVIPWLFKSSPDVTKAEDLVHTLSDTSSFHLTRTH